MLLFLFRVNAYPVRSGLRVTDVPGQGYARVAYLQNIFLKVQHLQDLERLYIVWGKSVRTGRRNIYEHFQRQTMGDRNKWRTVWREERKRREADEWLWDGRFADRRDEEWYEETWLLDSMKAEQERGALWRCPTCKAEYYVITPFRRLHCSECLSKLKSYRIVPVSMAKNKVKRHKFWTCEDYR